VVRALALRALGHLGHVPHPVVMLPPDAPLARAAVLLAPAPPRELFASLARPLALAIREALLSPVLRTPAVAEAMFRTILRLWCSERDLEQEATDAAAAAAAAGAGATAATYTDTGVRALLRDTLVRALGLETDEVTGASLVNTAVVTMVIDLQTGIASPLACLPALLRLLRTYPSRPSSSILAARAARAEAEAAAAAAAAGSGSGAGAGTGTGTGATTNGDKSAPSSRSTLAPGAMLCELHVGRKGHAYLPTRPTHPHVGERTPLGVALMAVHGVSTLAECGCTEVAPEIIHALCVFVKRVLATVVNLPATGSRGKGWEIWRYGDFFFFFFFPAPKLTQYCNSHTQSQRRS
jgi:hypothetical protein